MTAEVSIMFSTAANGGGLAEFDRVEFCKKLAVLSGGFVCTAFFYGVGVDTSFLGKFLDRWGQTLKLCISLLALYWLQQGRR